jgi:hypothetical protein
MAQSMSRSVRNYLASFNLSAIARRPDGSLEAVQDPGAAVEAWWLKSTEISRVLRAADANGGDVIAAAHRFEVPIAAHTDAVERAKAALSRIDAGLARAQSDGALALVNSEFKRRRLAARARGERYLPYAEIKRRLQKAMAGVAAGEAPPRNLLVRVFDEA